MSVPYSDYAWSSTGVGTLRRWCLAVTKQRYDREGNTSGHEGQKSTVPSRRVIPSPAQPWPTTGAQKVKLGVLIIGSLYWDDKPHRDKWRRGRLCVDAQQYVKAPIRYGRLSRSRGCSYTMVFSASLSEEQFGQAIVVPFKSNDLISEAEFLWIAERSPDSRPNDRISADWGCVALVENQDRPISDKLREAWTKRVSRERCYGQSMNSASGEKVAFDRSGFLNIPWPRSTDGSELGFNALIATATNPTIVGGSYPSAQQIANAWNTHEDREHVDYFLNNKKHGIKTFQDVEIEECLRDHDDC